MSQAQQDKLIKKITVFKREHGKECANCKERVRIKQNLDATLRVALPFRGRGTSTVSLPAVDERCDAGFVVLQGPMAVCLDFHTFVCTTCSGVHREFQHKCKGISMSKWSPEEASNTLQRFL